MCTMPYAMRKWKWTVQTFFSYEFMRSVTTFENVEKEKPATTHTYPVMKYCMTKNKDEIRYEIIRNDEHGLCVCVRALCLHSRHWTVLSISVFKPAREKQILYRWSQKNRLNMQLVYGSIFFFAFLLYFILSSYKWLIMCIYFIKSSKPYDSGFFLHFASTFESFNKTFQMQNAQF